MKIGHFINALVVNSELLIEQVRRRDIQRFIEFLFMALAGAPLKTPASTLGNMLPGAK